MWVCLPPAHRPYSTALSRTASRASAAHKVADLPPTSSVFSAFLGYNPVQACWPQRGARPFATSSAAFLTGRSFFPKLIAVPFGHGLHEALDFALACCLLAAGASMMLGKQYIHAAAPAQRADVSEDALPVAPYSGVVAPVDFTAEPAGQ